MEKNLKLNDFITYNIDKEKFIVKKHTIEIPDMEFSFDDTKISNKNKIKYKNILKQIKAKGRTEKFKSSIAYRKNGGRSNNGCGECSTFIEGMRKMFLDIFTNNKYNFFVADNMTLKSIPNFDKDNNTSV